MQRKKESIPSSSFCTALPVRHELCSGSFGFNGLLRNIHRSLDQLVSWTHPWSYYHPQPPGCWPVDLFRRPFRLPDWDCFLENFLFRFSSSLLVRSSPRLPLSPTTSDSSKLCQWPKWTLEPMADCLELARKTPSVYRRMLPILIFTIICLGAFTVAGVLSSKIATSTGAEVLVTSPKLRHTRPGRTPQFRQIQHNLPPLSRSDEQISRELCTEMLHKYFQTRGVPQICSKTTFLVGE